MARKKQDYEISPARSCSTRSARARATAQHVLHVADEGREPQGLQGERGGISRRSSADAGADARRSSSANTTGCSSSAATSISPPSSARPTAFVPASRRADDRLDAGGIRRDDARAAAARSKAIAVEVGQVRQAAKVTPAAARKPKAQSETEDPDSKAEMNAVAKIIAGVTSSHVPAIGAAIDNGRPRSRTGSGCSPASRGPSNGCARPSPTS